MQSETAYVSGKEPSASPLSKHVQSNMTSLDIVSVGVKVNLNHNVIEHPDWFSII